MNLDFVWRPFQLNFLLCNSGCSYQLRMRSYLSDVKIGSKCFCMRKGEREGERKGERKGGSDIGLREVSKSVLLPKQNIEWGNFARLLKFCFSCS